MHTPEGRRAWDSVAIVIISEGRIAMKQHLLILMIALGLALSAWSCSELKQDLPSPVSTTMRVHSDEWSQASSPNFHGAYLSNKNWNDRECLQCHGGSYQGGSSGVSCFKCHDAYPHSARGITGSGHRDYLYAKGYPLADCRVCHGADYGGGNVSTSCTRAGCHVDRTQTAKPPEACNTCHGNFTAPTSDFLSAAPPRSVLGDTVTTVSGVGAHAKHLISGLVGKLLKCRECHNVPSVWNAPGHLDSPLPADVVMNDTLANLVTGDGTNRPAPAYVGGKCNNTYCHGNWALRKASSPYAFVYSDSVITGAKYSPQWTGGSVEAVCGSCHGLPPQGHRDLTPVPCSNCHGEVVDANYKIIDPTKHINGKINLDGVEFNMR